MPYPTNLIQSKTQPQWTITENVGDGFWPFRTEYSQLNNLQNQHFGRNLLSTTTINKINILDEKFPNPCITQAIYITTYRLVERGYRRSVEWVRAECGERERESRVSSLVDPSENGGGRVSGEGGHHRMEPREKFERWDRERRRGEIEWVFGDFK